MATKKTATQAEEELTAVAEEVAAQATEHKFSVEKLGAHCRKLFGVSASTYAGATAGMTGEYTVAEMKAHIEEWGSKKGAK